MNTTRPWNTRSVKIGPYRPYDSSRSPSGSRSIRRVRRALTFVSPGGKGTDAARSALRSLARRRIGFVDTGWGPASDMGARYLRSAKRHTECWGWASAARGSMRRAMSPAGPIRRSHLLAAAGIAFALIFGLAFWVDDPREAITVLYVLPIALCALALGLRAGLIAACLATGLLALWVAASDVEIGMSG